jgi:quercetin dioxygenase-like cupin family protein
MKSRSFSKFVFTLLLALPLFIYAQQTKFEKLILHPSEIDWSKAETAANGVQTYTVLGNLKEEGYYIIMVRIPANTKLAPHFHPENRTVVVVSGKFGWIYGDTFDETKLHEMTTGTFFAEPGNEPHFALTKNEEVILQVAGFGPTGTTIIKK